jgi:transposase-like protein
LDLLAFYDLSRPLWKSLRSTNCLENLNRGFRRRTKTQPFFSSEAAAVTLLFGLLAFGQIKLRKVDGHRSLQKVLAGGAEKIA